MIGAVFDCVAFVQAVLSGRGPAFACLLLAEEKQFTLYLSPEILDEVKRTLDKPALRRKYATLTDERIASFLDWVVNFGTVVQNSPQVFSHRRDPKDEPYLNLAIATQAPFLVSRDKDLLDLMKDEEFRKACPGLTIIDPVAFLKHVRNEIGKEPG